MTSKLIVNNIEADAGVSTITFGSEISASKITTSSTSAFSSGLNVTGGSVGIGTDNPSHKLDVVGNTQLYGTLVIGDNTDISPTANGAGQLHIDGNGYTPYIAADGTAMYVGHNSSVRNLTLQTDETDRLTIKGNDGRVGIGTDNPQANLHIFNGNGSTQAPAAAGNNLVIDGGGEVGMSLLFGTTAATAYGNIYWGNSTDGSADGRITYFGSTYTTAADRQSMAFRTAGTERLRITSDGKIGINNTNPLYAMHFKNAMSSTPSYIHMEVTGTNAVGGGGGIQFDTSASNAESNNGLYLAQISGERSSSDDGSNQLVFKTSNAGSLGDDGNTHTPKTRMIIDENGHVTINDGNLIIGTSGHGIDFSATANGFNTSGVSELLDDYEQGNWTPTIRFGGSSTGVTYNEQSGTYVKIGNLVHLNVVITLTNKGSQTGDAEIGGYPFPTGGGASGSSSSRATGTVSFADGFSSLNSVPVIYSAGVNFSYGRLHHVNSSSGSGSGHAVLQNSNLSNTTTIRASITYTTF